MRLWWLPATTFAVFGTPLTAVALGLGWAAVSNAVELYVIAALLVPVALVALTLAVSLAAQVAVWSGVS